MKRVPQSFEALQSLFLAPIDYQDLGPLLEPNRLENTSSLLARTRGPLLALDEDRIILLQSCLYWSRRIVLEGKFEVHLTFESRRLGAHSSLSTDYSKSPVPAENISLFQL